MKKLLLKKTLIVIIVILFVGLAIVPIISSFNAPLETNENPSSKTAKFNPFKEGWNYRKKIIIDHDKVAGNLVNFPVLVSIIDSDLRDKAQLDGDDILFMNRPGKAEQLFHEVEYYDGDSGELVAWVNIPRLSSRHDTKIYLYYGNPECSCQEYPEMVWDSYYMAVHHMDDSTPSTISDSTLNHNTGFKYNDNDPKESEIGKAGKCQEHNTDFNYVRLEDGSSLDVGTGDATIEIWLKSSSYKWENFYYSDSFSDYNKISFLKLDAEYNNVGQIFVRGNSWNKYSYARGSTSLNDDRWHYIVCTIDNSKAGQNDDLRLFLDGEEETLSSENHEWDGTTLTNSRDKWVGKRKDVNKPFQGCIDEFRISKLERSDKWINTSFNAMNDPEGFLNFCSEEEYKEKFNPFKEGWNYRKKIIIDHDKVAGNLVNFPVLVSIIDSDLRDKAQLDGDDILFMNRPGKAEQLFHEVEYYDGDSGELVAWVNIPRLSSRHDTKIYLYYGNPDCISQEIPEMVWDSNYQAVWHLSEDGLGFRNDSTSNQNDGTPYNYEGDEAVLGQIDGADDFDGNNDHIRTGVSFDYNYRTISFWVKTDEKPFSNPNIILSQNAYTLKYGLVYANIRSDGLHAKAGGEAAGEEFIFNISINTWYMVQLVRYNLITKYYINGNLIDIGDSGDLGAYSNPNPNLVIGSSRLYNRLFDGIIDEIRISNIARSEEWISTGYNNQNDPSSFLSFDSEEKTRPKSYTNLMFQQFLQNNPYFFPLLQRLLDVWRSFIV